MSFNEYNCCIMRIGEMRIFKFFEDLGEKCGELFSKGKKEEEKKEEPKKEEEEEVLTLREILVYRDNK